MSALHNNITLCNQGTGAWVISTQWFYNAPWWDMRKSRDRPGGREGGRGGWTNHAGNVDSDDRQVPSPHSLLRVSRKENKWVLIPQLQSSWLIKAGQEQSPPHGCLKQYMYKLMKITEEVKMILPKRANFVCVLELLSGLIWFINSSRLLDKSNRILYYASLLLNIVFLLSKNRKKRIICS